MLEEGSPLRVGSGQVLNNPASTIEVALAELPDGKKPKQKGSRKYRDPVPKLSYLQVYEIIDGIRILEHRAFLALTYATMARVGEITFGDTEDTDAMDASNPPLSARDIEGYQRADGSRYLHIRVPREKQAERPWTTDTYISNTREGIGARLVGEQRAWLYNAIWPWAAEIKKRPPTVFEHLFPHSTKWGRRIFARYFGSAVKIRTTVGFRYVQNIHLLRAWRAQHLRDGSVTGEKKGIDEIAAKGGWHSYTVLQQHYLRTEGSDFRDGDI